MPSRFQLVTRTAEGYTVIRDMIKGENRLWIRGFTYKDWRCAESLNLIKRGDFAYRLYSPVNLTEGRLRIDAQLLDPL